MDHFVMSLLLHLLLHRNKNLLLSYKENDEAQERKQYLGDRVDEYIDADDGINVANEVMLKKIFVLSSYQTVLPVPVK